MGYDELYGGEGVKDSARVSSVLATEFQLATALVLFVFLLFRVLFGLVGGVIASAVTLLMLRGSVLSFSVFSENNDRFQNLLFYFLAAITAVVLLVGWRPW
ncbi:MAG: hypothetical protein ABIH11_04890 [Candidatus Altiarchaeota archaeon]